MVNFNEMADAICGQLADILKKKNHDYGDSFYRMYKKHGNHAPMLHMEEKLERLDTLLGTTEVSNHVRESIEDSLIDLAGYCVLTIISRMREKDDKEHRA